jgi:hypothetical protein
MRATGSLNRAGAWHNVMNREKRFENAFVNERTGWEEEGLRNSWGMRKRRVNWTGRTVSALTAPLHGPFDREKGDIGPEKPSPGT